MDERPSGEDDEERAWLDDAVDAALAAEVESTFPAEAKPSKEELLDFKARFPAIIRQYGPLIDHLLKFWRVERSLRPDLRQETLATLWTAALKRIPRLLDKTIAAIAWRLIANHLRRRKRRPPHDDGFEMENVAGGVDAERAVIFRMDLHAALERLSDPDAKLLVLIDLEELSYKDAAAELGIPVGTLGTRLSAARRRFWSFDDIDTETKRGQET
jgi:RNA polymerase sigma-70 factor (ECF subfamily)